MSRIHTIARTLCLTLACLAPWQAWSASTTPTQEAQALWLAGKREQAIQFVEEALKKTPDEPRLRFALASMLMEQQQLPRAKQLFVALTQDHPDLADPYNNLAVIHAAQGDYEAARQALVRALDLQPDHAQAQENLGDVLLRLSQQAYERALKLALGDDSGLKLKLQRVSQINGELHGAKRPTP